MLRNKIFQCLGLGLVALIVGCQGDIKEEKQQEAEKKEAATQFVQNPNVPRDMETIRRETRDYRTMKAAAREEKKADRVLMAKERLSNQEKDQKSRSKI